MWKVCGDQHSWILLGHTRLVSKEIVSHVKRRMLKLDYYFNLLIWSAMAIRCRWSVPQQPPKTLTVHFGLVPRLRQILPIVCPYSKGSPLSRVELSSNSSWLFVDPLPRRALFPFKQRKSLENARKHTSDMFDPGDPGLLNVKQVFEPWRMRAFDGIIGRRFFASRVQRFNRFLIWVKNGLKKFNSFSPTFQGKKNHLERLATLQLAVLFSQRERDHQWHVVFGSCSNDALSFDDISQRPR